MKFFIKSLFLIALCTVLSLQTKAQSIIYIQIAHNCADSTLDTLDLYFNGAILDSNVVYHTATGMFAYSADTAFNIGVSYKHSNGIPNYINTLLVPAAGELNGNHRYVFIISGVNSPNFNPDSVISIKEIANVDSAVNDTTHVAMRFFGGVTDLPAIDIKDLNSGAVYASDLTYGNSTSPAEQLRHSVYEWQVTDHNNPSVNYGTFYADLSGLASQSVIVLGSGFLNQQANDSGAAFGLFILENNGGVLTLPLETAGFQLLQNCADPAADSLDVYINGELAYPKLGFRNATPALLLKAHATYAIGIAPKNSTSYSQAFWKDTFNFPRDTFFIATATGLLSQTGFAANPQGISTAFKVLIKVPAEFEASAQNNFDFFLINGVTDAPPLNLVPTDGPLLLSNVDYAEQSGYVSLPAEFYTLNVQDTSGNTLASGFANFISFPSQSGVLLTSGFLHPSANNNGAALGLYMVPLSGGSFIPLFNATAVNSIATCTGLQIFPNPAFNQLQLLFNLPQSETASLQITDINGQVVKQVITNEVLTGEQKISVDISNLSGGLYFSRLITSSGTVNNRFAVTR